MEPYPDQGRHQRIGGRRPAHQGDLSGDRVPPKVHVHLHGRCHRHGSGTRVPMHEDGPIGLLQDKLNVSEAYNSELIAVIERLGGEPPPRPLDQGSPSKVVVVGNTELDNLSDQPEETTTTTLAHRGPTGKSPLTNVLNPDPEVTSMLVWARENWPALRRGGLESLGGITTHWSRNMEEYRAFRDNLDLDQSVQPRGPRGTTPSANRSGSAGRNRRRRLRRSAEVATR